ncbi:hypothetical protein GCM10028798_23560 [Humibacter antri]
MYAVACSDGQNDGSLVNMSTKFFRPTNSGWDNPLYDVKAKYADAQSGNTTNVVNPMIAGARKMYAGRVSEENRRLERGTGLGGRGFPGAGEAADRCTAWDTRISSIGVVLPSR